MVRWFSVREGMLGAYCWLLLVGGMATFPQFPSAGFKDLVRVAHS